MTLLGLGLVLAAAACHATWNYFVKRIDGGPELIWLFSVLSVAIYLPLAAIVVALEGPVFGPGEILFILGSAGLHLGYFLLLQQGYRRADLSLVYPTARAVGPFVSTAFAVAFLGEALSPQVAAGGLLVVTGVAWLTGAFRRGSRRPAASLLFGLGAGLLIGSYTVWDAYAVSVLLVPPLLLDYISSLARAILLAPIGLERRDEVARCWREHRFGVVAIAVFNPLAYILVLYALTFTPVVYVAPTREVSVLITVLMGSLLLGEGDLRRRAFWAVWIFAGIALLATA